MTTAFDLAAKGNRKAMTSLYEATKRKVYYTSLLLFLNKEDAVDATNFAFKNAWSSINAHNIKTNEEFTHLVIRKAVDYAKRKIGKKDNKAFRIPANRNFFISCEKAANKGYALVIDEVLRHLPYMQRFILVLHSVGEYLPEQIASTFKLDMKTVGIALDAEETNIERILKHIDNTEYDYISFMEEMKNQEEISDIPEEIDKYAASVIDNIAGPVEKKAKMFVARICIGILAAIIAVVGIVLIASNGYKNVTASDTESDIGDYSDESSIISEPVIDLDETATYYADIEIADYGTVTVELDQEAAPITVSNFINLAQNGFYDGLTFHRIMDGFMMQGGDPNGDGTGGADNDIVGEFSYNGYENNLSHTAGAISMARSDEYNSASSQFFIVHEDSTTLDGQYAVFGYVSEGMDVVNTVCESAEPTDDNGTIEADAQPVITSITIRTETVTE